MYGKVNFDSLSLTIFSHTNDGQDRQKEYGPVVSDQILLSDFGMLTMLAYFHIEGKEASEKHLFRRNVKG